MKKSKILLSCAAAAALTVSCATVNAYALSWLDGAPANYHFTYTATDEGVNSVNVSDTNGTYSGTIEPGQTITTKTGTVAWRGSYTNTTTFTVAVEPGYVLNGISGNVGDAYVVNNGDNTYSFQFTDKGAEAWCYGDDVDFTLDTEKVNYTFVDTEGNTIGTGKIGEAIILADAPEKTGHTFAGYSLNGQFISTGSNLTEDMIAKADKDNKITFTAEYNANSYMLTVNYYVNNNNDKHSGSFERTATLPVQYGTTVGLAYLADNDVTTDGYAIIGGESVVIDTDNNVINLVRTDKAESGIGSLEYSFTFAGNEANVEKVTYSIDDGEANELELNETIKVETSSNILNSKVIKFTVETVNGEAPVLDCTGTENNIVDNGDGTYSFQITVQGYNNDKHAHFDFFLK